MASNNSSSNSSVRPFFPFPKLPNDEVEVIGSSVVYMLLSITIIIGNSLVIAAYRYNSRLQTVTNAFLVGLAVSDLLVGLISVPIWVYFSVCQQYHTCVNNQSLQVFYATADIFVGCASVLQLTAISIERFIAITRPIVHRTYSTSFYNTLIITAWCYAFVMSVLFPIQVTRWEKVYTVILFTTCFALPTIVIFVVYVIIFKTAVFSSEVRVSPEGIHKRTVQQEAKIAVTIAVITGLFVMAWLPFFIVNVIGTFCMQCFPPYPGILRLIRFVKWMHYSNSMVNPIIYAYRNREMRRTFIRILRRIFCRCTDTSLISAGSQVDGRSRGSRARRDGFNTDSKRFHSGKQGSSKDDPNAINLNYAYKMTNNNPPMVSKNPDPFDSGVQSGEHNGNHSEGPPQRGTISKAQASCSDQGPRCDVIRFKGMNSICEDEGMDEETPEESDTSMSDHVANEKNDAAIKETLFASVEQNIK
ncbi:octopamine receptor Oamb-like [Actinia tenebrosa]|uniref:Octopamine receptor Oamb-like n=1 Tax=Actinia tenebrosa TaxID=6105 RepID=A0A6P8IV37_ACTTE|nr:octopamine receptor Oamb-like [Actinia tenebrosa]